jgi:NAD(P)-dependent dehydrogenase (short-subunit alcohol dehydrogenase family)
VIALGKAKDQIEKFRKEFNDDPLASVEQADVRDRAELETLRDRLPSLDILVPNAGVNTRVKALDLQDAALREMFDTNLYGVFITCQVFGPLLFARPGGRVIVTSSLTAVHGMDLRAAYSATKAGLSGLVRSLAIEWGPKGVTVNAVGPGIIKTPLTSAYMDQFPERVTATIAHTPLRRLGEPEDVADVVAFLASDQARFITGQTIYVDGGISAGSEWW